MYWILGFVAVGGAILAIQTAVNGRLGTELSSPLLATTVSFLVGTVALVAYLAATRTALPGGGVLGRIPWWAWTGGLLGATYLMAVITAVPRLGVAVTMTLVVAGQTLMAVILDHYGLLGLDRHPATLPRLVGVVLVILGVLLVRRF